MTNAESSGGWMATLAGATPSVDWAQPIPLRPQPAMAAAHNETRLQQELDRLISRQVEAWVAKHIRTKPSRENR